MQITPARVVTFLAPVFTALSAVGTGWLSRHFPGLPHLSTAEVVAFEGAGATAALSAALKFVHGSSLYERAVLQVQSAAKVVNTVDPGAVTAIEKAAATAATQGEAKLVAVIDNRGTAFPFAPAETPPTPAAVVPVEPTPPAAA